MMSAGESDIETDRVSYLHTTALGFAPFIFDLSEDHGFSELMKICEGVWEEIKENDSLPDKLVSVILSSFPNEVNFGNRYHHLLVDIL